MTALSTNHDKGVTSFQGEPIYYELNAAGGWDARIVGAKDLLPASLELEAAIAADIAHQRSKA